MISGSKDNHSEPTSNQNLASAPRSSFPSQKAGVSFSISSKPAGGVSGGMGWQSGTYVAKDKTGKVVETGKYLSVSMKKGGKWLYVRDTWNADGAPTPAETAAPAKK